MKRASELTDNELRVMIAEDQGWKRLHEYAGAWGRHMQRTYILPNYPSCLNAMHEAWKTLTPSEKVAFEAALYDVVVGNAEYYHNDDAPRITNATARQRAEAYALTRKLALP